MGLPDAEEIDRGLRSGCALLIVVGFVLVTCAFLAGVFFERLGK